MATRALILRPGYFPLFDNGKPVANGYIYIGQPDLDPEIPANQKAITFLQEDGSQVPGSQPVRTSAGGVPTYNGSPVTVLVDGNYSVKVLDKHGAQVYYVPKNADLQDADIVTQVADITAMRALTGLVNGQAVEMTTTGRAGLFVFDDVTDYSAEVAADTQEGVYVSVTSGGVLVRQYGQGGELLPPINGSWFGLGETADDTTRVQPAINFAHAIVLSKGRTAQLDIASDIFTSDTISIPVTAQGVSISFNHNGVIRYSGTNDRPALLVGQSGVALFTPTIKTGVVNLNQSDWTDSACVGVLIKNANSAPNLLITRATGFYSGVEVQGDGQGFAYNNVSLGYIIDNRNGLSCTTINSGWCNENVFIGGRFAVSTGVNSAKARVGILTDGAASACNNNVFIKPSFELNNADAPSLGTGWVAELSISNHIIDCRSENTANIVNFDSDSSENLVEVGFSDASSRGVIDAAPAGNVVIQARTRSQNYTVECFRAQDLLSASSDAGGGTLSFLGVAAIANTSTGSIQNFILAADATVGVDLQDGARAIGARINTEFVKTFTISAGYFGAVGGRIFVLCFDSGGLLLEGTTPQYAVGGLGNALSVSGRGYKSGADSQDVLSVKLHDDVKSAFIGVMKGSGGDITINSVRIGSQAGVDGALCPSVFPIE